MDFENAELFPVTSAVNGDDHLVIGGCDTVSLAEEFGTPLYIYDELTLRQMCQSFVGEFVSRYTNTLIAYASKAFINPALARIINEEGLGLDVVSGGEIAVANTANFPRDKIFFHGNNKTAAELEYALSSQVGTIVVDGFSELTLLNQIASRLGKEQNIMLRLSPSVDAHTHQHTTTGILDSKFGFSMETGDAAAAIRLALKSRILKLTGLHFHLGSPIFELEPYSVAIDNVLTYAEKFRKDGLQITEFSPGGGFAIGYVREEPPPAIKEYASVITSMLVAKCDILGLDQPRLIVEPGRSIIGRAGVALYTVGVIKDIPTVRKYVSLDGGMGDNIRPALYGAKYDAVLANRVTDSLKETVSLAGKYCESGDILIKDISLPIPQTGDMVAIPGSGAYAPAMASNYNCNPRPAIVIASDGDARLIRRRETYDDLMACDLA